MHYTFSDIGALISVRKCGLHKALAAGTGDNTEVTHSAIDRYVNGANGAAGIFNSAVCFILAEATLDALETFKIKATMQDSADDAVADPYADVAAACQPPAAATGTRAADALVLTLTAVGADTYEGSVSWDVNLESLKRYLKLQTHIDLSRGATDVGNVAVGMVLGGGPTLPVT